MSKLVLSLLSLDLHATYAFYEQLGFCLSGGAADSGWIEVSRDGAVLQFYAEPPLAADAKPVLSGTIYLHIDAIDDLAIKLRERFAFEWGPETMDYGMREFAVRDPNGYLLAFAAPA
jgi:catechol 2,3-dioxygenase-like lactoylglutathione lyase family enzyme